MQGEERVNRRDRHLLMLVSELSDLREWEPVGSRMEAVKLQIAHIEGLTDDEARRIEVMAVNWRRIHPSVRAFYAVWAKRDTTVSVALWRVLNVGATQTPPPPLDGWQRGALRRLWTETYGCPCPFDLYPVDR